MLAVVIRSDFALIISSSRWIHMLQKLRKQKGRIQCKCIFIWSLYHLQSPSNRCGDVKWWQNQDREQKWFGEKSKTRYFTIISAETRRVLSSPSHFQRAAFVLPYIPPTLWACTHYQAAQASHQHQAPTVLLPSSPEIIRVLQMKSQSHKSGTPAPHLTLSPPRFSQSPLLSSSNLN